MQELTSTRTNALVDPGLHVWHAEIPLYLFLGGLVAGIMVLSGLRLLRNTEARPSRALALLPWAAPVLLSVGMLFLWLDLANRWNVLRFYLALRPASPMSWGAWILLAIYPASILLALRSTPPELRACPLAAWSRRFAASPLTGWLQRLGAWADGRTRGIALANVLLGSALGIYTGILLSALGARPLWSSALLGPLFLVSGLSTGAAFMLLYRLSPEERRSLGRADAALIAVEMGLLALWLIGLATGGSAAREAAGVLLGGPYTAAFWTLVVAVGLVTPLAAEALELRRREIPGRMAALFVLAGGLALRWILVYAGQHTSWLAALR